MGLPTVQQTLRDHDIQRMAHLLLPAGRCSDRVASECLSMLPMNDRWTLVRLGVLAGDVQTDPVLRLTLHGRAVSFPDPEDHSKRLSGIVEGFHGSAKQASRCLAIIPLENRRIFANVNLLETVEAVAA